MNIIKLSMSMAAMLSLAGGEAIAVEKCADEYDNVIHPGKADGSEFWNVRSVWFMYAPAFGFQRVNGAVSYRFAVTPTNGTARVFAAAEPTASLAPVWRDVPVGDVTVVCEGVGSDGKVLGKAGERSFLKVAGFREGAYPPPTKPFREAACGVYDYAFKMPALQYLLDTGKLDMSDAINSYASKACAGFISAMVNYAKLEPSKRERALAIARKAAEYLIDGAEKGDAPLAWFPQTYDGVGEKDTAKKNKGLIMLIYPAVAASAFLDLYEATKEPRWLDYAEKIAGTYLKLQGEDGTWYLKMRAADGKPVNPNRLVPVDSALPLLEKLYRLTGKSAYRTAADRAFAYVDRTLLKDWNWEGQFEDVPPSGKYFNLTKHDAVSTAILLLERFPNDPERRRQARELMRFAEDQFVCWEEPAGGGPVRYLGKWRPSKRYDDWVVPCALEQYHCYWPIDASAAKVIRGYLALYRVEHNPVDLAKARTLGATMTRVQEANGRIPTWWWKSTPGRDWMNCMFGSARALLQLAEFEGTSAAKPHAVLELRHGPGNPRNSEGDFAVLKDGRILFAYSKYTGTSGHDHAQCVIAARESSDRGETWSGDRILAVNEKDPQGNVMSVSLLRLKSGKLALFYIVKEGAADGRITSSILMKTSADEGKTWSSPRDCSFICPIAYRVLNNARIVRLKSGRVLIPLAEHRACPEGGDKVEGSAHLFCLYSDDDCATWKMSEYVPHPPRHCQQEPGVIELKDGRVMMWYRTGEGRQWQAFSADAGQTWSAPEPSTMYSPCSPATIVRLKSGQLLGVWNDHENRTDLMITDRKGRREPARTPLTVGLSSDEGRTWPRRRNLEDGFDQAHGRRYWYCYTAVLELDDRLLIAYCAENGLSDSRITLVPREWISASRVPEPQPVKSCVEITALYYPGTEQRSEWDMVAQTCPERKPLLGWYDEGNPEAIDWQIKWAVEHGITSFCVDWYWNKGYQRLTHWVKGFQRARYRKYLKWYMMYANHNQPGAHSTADQIEVTKYWIDHYFKTPEYYTIDGKPVVCYWQPKNLDRDFIAEAAAKGEKLAPGEGVKRALAISERLAKEAGLPGIHWQLIGRGASHDSATALAQREMGFASAISYGFDNWPAYDMAVEAMPKIWQAKAAQSDLPWWVPLPTGWDDRPRSFAHARIVRDRTPEKFAAICREARRFCDKNGIRHVIIHPINEWQEGSYIEPNEEFGFGMYDAIRDAFCERPAAGWPKNLKPSDVGLGPYDFPESYHSPVQTWNFDSGSMEGWYRQPYGGGELEVKDGALNFWITRLNNYNIRQCVQPFAASKYSKFRIRMRITPNPGTCPDVKKSYVLRLKWGTPELPIIGRGLRVDNARAMVSTPVKLDGEWHEYEVPLASCPDWKGMVDELWFEACALMHARVAIDWMGFAGQ